MSEIDEIWSVDLVCGRRRTGWRIGAVSLASIRCSSTVASIRCSSTVVLPNSLLLMAKTEWYLEMSSLAFATSASLRSVSSIFKVSQSRLSGGCSSHPDESGNWSSQTEGPSRICSTSRTLATANFRDFSVYPALHSFRTHPHIHSFVYTTTEHVHIASGGHHSTKSSSTSNLSVSSWLLLLHRE